ncbi:Protein tyrosine phosphatase-like protein, PTPLA domain containing protein [Tylopilus felleus]
MYLIAFNLVSALGWAVVLVASLVPAHSFVSYRAVNALSTHIASYISFIPPTHAQSWSVLAPVQSLAALEVLHVLLGLVRSPLPTTFVQVSSRLILVWAIVARYPSTHTSPIYTTMVLAWSLTEVPRYTYYALSLLGITPPFWLTWLRYSTFYILYPLGAGSEALLALSTISEWQNGRYANWLLEDWLKATMVLIWIPGLYVMYTHMMRTRAKVLGPKPKDRLKAN